MYYELGSFATAWIATSSNPVAIVIGNPDELTISLASSTLLPENINHNQYKYKNNLLILQTK